MHEAEPLTTLADGQESPTPPSEKVPRSADPSAVPRPRLPIWRRLLRGAGDAGQVVTALDALSSGRADPPQLPCDRPASSSRATLEHDLALHAWKITKTLRLGADDLRFADLARMFKTPAFFELLIRASRVEGRGDRQHGIAVAELALKSLRPLSWELGRAALGHLQALGWAALANARALAWDLDLAEVGFVQAERFLKSYEPAPAIVRAEVWYLRSCHKGSQRQWQTALDLIQRAEALVVDDASSELRAEILIQRGGVYLNLGMPKEAVVDFQAGVEILPSDSDPFLHLAGRGNLATALASAKRHHEAQAALTSAKRFAADAAPCVLDHLTWLEGLLAIATDNDNCAYPSLCRAREGFRARGELGHVAIISLDVAALFARQGRTAEVVDVLSEALLALDALKLDAETLASVNLLREALAGQALATSMVRQLRDRLAAVFQAPTV